MRVLFVMDSLKQLNFRWDTSLCLLRELVRRGHTTWTADTGDVWAENNQVLVHAEKVFPKPRYHFQTSKPKRYSALQFDLILIRKEPPFDLNYFYLTYLLELVADKIPVVNHPRGIRNANEKLSILNFPNWLPETMVSNSWRQILEFQNQIKGKIVLKPLDEKGGTGVLLLNAKGRKAKFTIQQATLDGRKFILAQEFLKGTVGQQEKRILLLNGNLLTVYEKRPPKGDFRANLVLGGTAHPATLTLQEKELIAEMKPYLLREGLLFVGLDVMANQLIEINVTCPAGLTDAIDLYPHLGGLAGEWASSLEDLVRL